MAEQTKPQSEKPQVAKRDRSPSFPFIPLGTAIDRLAALDEYFKRHPAPVSKVGLAWGIKEGSSQSAQTIAALKSFGLVDYQGSGTDLKAMLTEDGRNYLRAQQDEVKRQILLRCATKPKLIAKYFEHWGADRPPDAVCLDELVLKAAFSQAGAETFLKVYDATVAFSGLAKSDKVGVGETADGDKGDRKPKVEVGDLIQAEVAGALVFEKPRRVRAIQQHEGADWVFVDGHLSGVPMEQVTIEQKGSGAAIKPPPTLPLQEGATAASPASNMERELLRGPLSKTASYRLVVSGDLGPKELGKLIKLLEAQKTVLSDDDEEDQL